MNWKKRDYEYLTTFQNQINEQHRDQSLERHILRTQKEQTRNKQTLRRHECPTWMSELINI